MSLLIMSSVLGAALVVHMFFCYGFWWNILLIFLALLWGKFGHCPLLADETTRPRGGGLAAGGRQVRAHSACVPSGHMQSFRAHPHNGPDP